MNILSAVPSYRRALPALICSAWALVAGSATGATAIQTDHDAYFPGEEIRITFSGGPGSAKDWIGVYQPEQEPGPVGSTIWRYVDNTQTGAVGNQSGAVTFPGGLALAGDWVAYFLLNDGYEIVATNTFKVVEPGSPLVRVGNRVYKTGETITLSFVNGPGNPKDWLGIYKEGQTPGGPLSTLWAYVDNTQDGNSPKIEGTVSFASGLTEPGAYVAYFLLNDGYDVLATESFRVETAVAVTAPSVVRVSPADGATGQAPSLAFSAVVADGTAKVVAGSIRLELDGAVVTPQITNADGQTTIAYTSPTLPAAGSEHRWVLTFADDATPPGTQRVERTLTVGAYENLQLPAPLYFENFDALAEGSLPAGWTQKSYTTPLVEAADFQDLSSVAYAGWTTVEADRFKNPFKTYGNPDSSETDYQRVLRANPFNVVNGSAITGPLGTGKLLFGNSGYQNGSSGQVLYLFTRDYDLTGKTNVHLGFHSLWEQNQDSIAAIEYSIDQGATWWPAAYFLHGPDIVKVEGTEEIDVEATFGTERPDVARYVDDLGAEVGGTYGTFLGAAVGPDLAPFIQGRIDDDPVGSKRVELLRLVKADQQRTVRIRIAHAGTDSWYFGIDNFGLYEIGAVTGPAPTLGVVREGAGLRLSWPGDAAAYRLEISTTGQPGSWSTVSAVTGTSHVVTPTGTAAFYRLAKP